VAVVLAVCVRHFGDACAHADEAASISSFVSYVRLAGSRCRWTSVLCWWLTTGIAEQLTQDGKEGSPSLKRRKLAGEQSISPTGGTNGASGDAADQHQFMVLEHAVEDVEVASNALDAFHDHLPVRRRTFSDDFDVGGLEVRRSSQLLVRLDLALTGWTGR
jgi:hypothetical protein